MSADIKPQPTPPTPIKPTGFHPKFWPAVIIFGLFVPLLFINPGQKQAVKVKNNAVYSFSSSSSDNQSSTSGASNSNSGLFGLNFTWPSFSVPGTGQSVATNRTSSTTASPTEVSGFNEVNGTLGSLFRPAQPLANGNIIASNDQAGATLVGRENDTMRLQDSDQAQNESINGKIKYDPSAEYSVMSDKFQPGKSAEINYNGQRSIITVERGKILETDTYFHVNREIFISLGGNPDNGDVIDVTLIRI